MVEASRSFERHEQERPSFEQIVAHFERIGLPLGQAEVGQLITSLELTDLTNDQLAQTFGRPPIAKVRGHALELDRRFQLLEENQQTHILLHELSHPLIAFFRQQSDTERFGNLTRTINQLPSNQVSYYANYLENRLPDNAQKARILEEERLAEIFAQYLESDRSFAGFIQAKLLEFPQGDQELDPAERTEFEKIVAQIGELGEYLEIAESEAEWEAFLEHHSDLLPHYQLWREVNDLFAETDFSALHLQDYDDDDAEVEEYWEDLALAQHLHPEPSGSNARTIFKPAETQKEKKEPSLLGDIVTFWRLFPPTE